MKKNFDYFYEEVIYDYNYTVKQLEDELIFDEVIEEAGKRYNNYLDEYNNINIKQLIEAF